MLCMYSTLGLTVLHDLTLISIIRAYHDLILHGIVLFFANLCDINRREQLPGDLVCYGTTVKACFTSSTNIWTILLKRYEFDSVVESDGRYKFNWSSFLTKLNSR